MLGPNTEHYVLPWVSQMDVDSSAHGVARGKSYDGALRRYRVNLGIEKIHARRANEAGHEDIVRVPVKRHRRADLLDATRR